MELFVLHFAWILTGVLQSGCSPAIVDIPGAPQCETVDLGTSQFVCSPMRGDIKQQEFTCVQDTGPDSPQGSWTCRQKCTQTRLPTNTTVEFYSDCTAPEPADCTVVSPFAINSGCTQNGVATGTILEGCADPISPTLDGIFCNLTACDMSKSLIDVYDKCKVCVWITVFADGCERTSSGFYDCINVDPQKQATSKFGCRAISCSTYGTEGFAILNSSTTYGCWETNWSDHIP